MVLIFEVDPDLVPPQNTYIPNLCVKYVDPGPGQAFTRPIPAKLKIGWA